jgi:diacylglycerol kinase (ATP)
VLVDLVIESYHPKAKIVKDAAAGGVLMSAIVSVIIGYIIFIDRVGKDAEKLLGFLRGLDLKVTAAILICTIVLLLIINTLFKKEVFQKGILDTVIAFVVSAIAAAVVMWNGSIQSSILFFGICVVVVLSRVKRKLQNIYNLLIGVIPGFLAVLVIYQAIKG